MDEIKWCPTQGGTYTAYVPEYFDGNEWKRIPIVKTIDSIGIPAPLMNGGISETVGLYGYEQAHALAWTHAAYLAAIGKKVEVRVQAYEVVYEIKARKIE